MSVKGQVQIAKKDVVVAVNKTAIQHIKSKPVIFVKEGKDRYEAHHVTLGEEDGNYVEVVKGLRKGEEYVSQGSFLIKADILKLTAKDSD